MKEKSFITHKSEMSAEAVYQMIESMDKIFYQVERFNEILSEEIKKNHPIFMQFIRALLLSNCHAIKATLQIKETLDKTMDDFLEKSEPNITE